MILLSGSSHSTFAQALAKQANLKFGLVEHSTFLNGDRRVWITSQIKDEDVVIVQSLSTPVDSHLVEYALLVDAAERLGAASITAVIPWMGYSLQDKVFRPGEPIAARVVADILSNRAVRRVILLDLHNNSVAGFFSVPTTVLSSVDSFADDIKKKYGKEDCVMVSPDFGGLKRANMVAEKLKFDIAHIDKRRNVTTGEVHAKYVGEDVKGKTCIVIDDVINSGSTIIEGAQELKNHGAKKVIFYATHALLAGKATELLQASTVDEVVVGDTVSIPKEKLFQKLRQISMIPLFADAIKKEKRD
jgi:ribose-phosphate pyrophosphokinase